MNPLRSLNEHGQVVWLDFLSRRFIADGSLQRLIDEDGLAGATSNPSIFEKAIVGSRDYDAELIAAGRVGNLDERALFERIAVEDIRNAADVLRPVYNATRHRDGYISIEVSPYLAMRADATVEEARRLWRSVDRDNLMIKVPATRPGLSAIRQLTGEGINVNVTLLFSQKIYEGVVEAYLRGLEDLVARGGNPGRIASVASFFVSRIDTAVDKLLDARIDQTRDNAEHGALTSIRGKVAIANAKLAYQRYKRLFAGPRWEALRAKGARTQRLLWASTGTKRRALCRGADRPRHDQYNAAGHDGCLSRPRKDSRQPRGGPASGSAGVEDPRATRHLPRRGHGQGPRRRCPTFRGRDGQGV
jgi:transaldolase/glucose-6-phosphate isomerase